jgi:uncharacterized membrane protein YheB (UPF0754 family)
MGHGRHFDFSGRMGGGGRICAYKLTFKPFKTIFIDRLRVFRTEGSKLKKKKDFGVNINMF